MDIVDRTLEHEEEPVIEIILGDGFNVRFWLADQGN